MSESPRKSPALKAALGGVVLGALVLAGLGWAMRCLLYTSDAADER